MLETTQYLITIAKRLMSYLSFRFKKEYYFISEDINDTLQNIKTKQAIYFVDGTRKADLYNNFYKE